MTVLKSFELSAEKSDASFRRTGLKRTVTAPLLISLFLHLLAAGILYQTVEHAPHRQPVRPLEVAVVDLAQKMLPLTAHRESKVAAPASQLPHAAPHPAPAAPVN